MSKQPIQGELFASPRSSDVVPINERCLLRKCGRHRIVVVCGVPVAQFAADDRVAHAYAMVNLVEQGWADRNDVACAFGCSTRTLRRHQTRVTEGGLAALGRPRGYPQGRSRVPRCRKRRILRLKEQGRSNRGIAQELGIHEKSVRKLLKQWGWKPAAVAPPELFDPAAASPSTGPAPESADPKLSAFSDDPEPPPFTLDRDPLHRVGDRLLARLELLEDAAPLFCAGHVPHAGVLVAVPSLLRSGIFQIAREIYGHIGPINRPIGGPAVGGDTLSRLRLAAPIKRRLFRDVARSAMSRKSPLNEAASRRRAAMGIVPRGRACERDRRMDRMPRRESRAGDGGRRKAREGCLFQEVGRVSAVPRRGRGEIDDRIER
jgi:transposase